MKIYKYLISFLLLSSTILFAQTLNVDNLMEKVNQSADPKEKKELIEKLKKQLAKKNKQAQDEANAIIRAKQKIPSKTYKENSLYE